MPFNLEKGTIFATFEALYDNPDELRRLLLKLWNDGSAALGSLGMITSPTFDDTAHPTKANALGSTRLKSMREDWFGERPDGWKPEWWGQKHRDPEQPPAFTTGYWQHFQGDVRGIVAETLQRAAEVSLGVDRPSGATVEAVPPSDRHWPVEFFWKCGQARFEGWVTWRDKTHGRSGQVTVVFCTPATPDEVLNSPAKGAEVAPPADWMQRWQGMWVCSHYAHKQHLMITSAPTQSGRWYVPEHAVMFTEGTGDVGTWAPTFGGGGAAKEWTPFERGSEVL